MGAFGLFLVSLATCLVASVRGNYFFVVAPNMIRFEHPETVMVNVLGSQKAVRLWFSHKDRPFSKHDIVVREDTPRQVEMMVRETDLALEERESKPRTILLNAECDGVLRQKEIFLQYSSGYIFVLTSQPMYVPESIVRIHSLALTESMQKIGQNVTVTRDIISPRGQVFSRSHTTEASYGFSFKLPPNTEIGKWTVNVYFRGLYETEAKAYFEVREYVLPTFGVDVKIVPQTIMEEVQGNVFISVTAKYVYGKPVDGTADIRLYLMGETEQIELTAIPKKPLNEGMAEFEVSMDYLISELVKNGKWFPEGQRLKVIATATEGATLKKEAGINTDLMFSKVPYRFTFARSKKYFRPLMQYFLQLDVTLPNGQPAAGVYVKVSTTLAGYLEERNGETDDNGEITFVFNSGGDTMTFWASDMENRSLSDPFTVEPYGGPNQILAEHLVKYGENQIRIVNNMQYGTSTGLISMFVARGKIMEQRLERPGYQILKVLTPNLLEQISPSGRYIIFYCDKRTDQVVADSVKLTVTPRCKGEGIHLRTDERVVPGGSESLRVLGEPGTHVTLSVLDKAGLLLNSKNVLHKNKLFQELDSHDMGCGYGGGRNSAEVFSNAGLTVITNAHMDDTLVRDSASCGRRLRNRGSSEPGVETKWNDSDTQNYLDDLSASNLDEKNIYVRRNFRESLQFEDHQIGETSGGVDVRLMYPDSITEWMIQAIGVSPNNGVCISEPLNVTSFRSFFTQLDLPYSTKRMEYVKVEATVFFYGDGGPNGSVSIYMDGTNDFCSSIKPGEKSKKKEFDIAPNSAITVQFPIIPMVAPKDTRIKITAILNWFGIGQVDAIEKKLHVINEGEEKLIKLQTCLDPMNQLQDCQTGDDVYVTYLGDDRPTQLINIGTTLPEHINGTAQGVAYIYSDNALEDDMQAVVIDGVAKFILNPAVGNVENIIIRLAPLVYAMKYLRVTGLFTEEMEMKGYIYVRAGVQRQYRFAKEDHSYPPAFRPGSSTWLTAFISKVFCQARNFVDGAVAEPIHVTPTINWLGIHQNADGSFTEHSNIVYHHLKGPSMANQPALTAFILIAMLECRTGYTNVETVVQRATAFLETLDMNMLRQDQYALSIVTYALVLSNSKRKMEFYEVLKDVAGRAEGMMYWGWPGTGDVESSHTEATSYGLLALLQLNDIQGSTEAVKWLSLHWRMRSSQVLELVIGLQALSEYNIKSYNTDVDLTVKFMAENYTEKIFRLDKDNVIVTDFPVEVDSDLRIEVTGKGTGIMRFELRYNVETSDVDKCPFQIDLKSELITAIGEQGCDCGVCGELDSYAFTETVDMAFSEANFVDPETKVERTKRSVVKSKLYCITLEVTSLMYNTGMIKIDIGLQTGMTVFEEDLEILVNNGLISMYELPTNRMGFFILYIEGMEAGQPYRFAFTLEDTAVEAINNRQPALVEVVDYYNQDARCQAFYGTGSNSEPTFKTECNGDACRCLISTCPFPWREKLIKIQKPAEFLIKRTCKRNFADYAIQVKILHANGIDYERRESVAAAEVMRVYRQGRERLYRGSEMSLYWRMDCEWPQFKPGTRYYIIAKDGMSYREQNIRRIKYYIKEGDVVLKWMPRRTRLGRALHAYENWWRGRQCPK